MKKALVLLTSLFLLVGCSLANNPRNTVDNLFKKYKSLDEEVISDLELTSESSMFKSSDQKEDYINVMKKQYSDLEYEITDEKVNGDEAEVTVNITVYDFYKSQKESDNYLLTNQSEFTTDDVYDAAKFLTYKIKQMMDAEDRVEYTIKVDLVKEEENWLVKPFDSATLKKIHGTYNYENN